MEEINDISVILDGSNIGRHSNNSKDINIRHVLQCREELLLNGIPRNRIFIVFGSSTRHHLREEDKELYKNLQQERNTTQGPVGQDDDWFIIRFALKHGSYIISNDKFRDYRAKYPEYADFLEKKSVRYTILGYEVIFDEKFCEILRNENGEIKYEILMH